VKIYRKLVIGGIGSKILVLILLTGVLISLAFLVVTGYQSRMLTAQILTDTNAAICANNREEMFITVWLGILELSTGVLTAANAGHEYPILRTPAGVFELYFIRTSTASSSAAWRECSTGITP
jgi:Serine phosphatase RsbU, regulator of sigma subunit